MSSRPSPVRSTEQAAEPAASRWEAVRPSAVLLGAAVGLAALSVLPARWTLSVEQGGGAATRWLTLGGGLLTDVALVGPVVTVVVALLLWASRRGRKALLVGSVALGALLALSCLAHNAAMEFRIQRGVFPGPIEAREGLGHGDFLLAEVPSLLGGRFLGANLACFACALGLGALTRRQLAAMANRSTPYLRILAALGLSVSVTIALGARRASAYGAGLHNPGALGSPAGTLLGRWLGGADYDGSPEAVRRLLVRASGTPSERALGASHMGFGAETAERLARAEEHADCMSHPLARPLEAEGTELLEAARAVSRELFRGRAVAPIVYHVSLESLRADDVHALANDAPPALTPFLSRTYGDERRAASFRHAHQSGVRTAQALSAVMCGYGALPFHLALGRDLGALPLRCAPDVLVDAGFRARAYYGHELVFDDMGTFLHHHGLGLHERRHFPAGAPRGVWDGVSDASVYDAAVDGALEETRAQYNFILTLSHHNPYTPPADLSAESRRLADELCAARGLAGENCARLHTLRYSDDALGRFVARVEGSSQASRSILVFAADHTTHQWVPWGSAERPDAIARIPFVIWLPEALRRGVVDPAAFEAAWGRFRGLAATRPVSNADLPSILLGLLDASPAFASLPAVARWHTLGSQATSPSFRSPTGDGVVFGIDAHAHPFHVSEGGAVHTSPVPMEALRGGDDVERPSGLNGPTLAFWGSFLRGYAAACPRSGQVSGPGSRR